MYIAHNVRVLSPNSCLHDDSFDILLTKFERKKITCISIVVILMIYLLQETASK